MTKIETIRSFRTAQAYLLTSQTNIFYACGFSGDSSQLLITDRNAFLFTDSRYTLQAQKDIGDTAECVVTGGAERNAAISAVLKDCGVGRLAIEKDDVTVSISEAYQKAFGCAEYVDISGEMLRVRAVKTHDEIEKIVLAAQATEEVLEELLPVIRAGVSEFDICAELLYRINKRGMQSAFAPIVAAGCNSAIPHATTTDYRLREGDLLTLDFGCKYQGYCSDITRTFGIGNVDEQRKKLYDIVKTAQQRALLVAEVGVPARRIDEAARTVIAENGYGNCFGHGTGHGVGLQIHELPVINPSSGAVLEKNMAYTVEPGIYVPGVGGVRIEDTCIAGMGSLYRFSKELILI